MAQNIIKSTKYPIEKNLPSVVRQNIVQAMSNLILLLSLTLPYSIVRLKTVVV